VAGHSGLQEIVHMDLRLNAQEAAFRDEVRAFLREHLPPELATKVKEGLRLTRDDMARWHAILHARGWLASHWPREWGGAGWNPVQRFIFETECALAGAPRIVPFGVHMLGPVLIRYGTEAQKRTWLPRILDGSDWWCQGYSEPGAGSDLASLKTTAVREGDHYLVNGQKTWTTLGHYANRMFCLVRTNRDAKPQEGISFLLLDLDSPGVEVRPIVTLDGEHEVNEVFLTNVRVPLDRLVGEENQGWSIAKYLLTYERTNIAGVGFSMAALERLKLIAQRVQKGGRPLIEDPLFAARMARVEIELENLKTTNLRVLAGSTGGAASGALSSLLKILGTQVRQEILSLTRRAVGPYALPWIEEALTLEGMHEAVGPSGAASAAPQYFNHRKLSIYGGSNEIQKNIVAKTVLGL
jgi:alkylation response protein AidB-like acyl-CoA dehydrogenase